MATNIVNSTAKSLPLLAARGSDGLFLFQDESGDYTKLNKFNKDESKNCRVMCFHSSGNLFAYSNGNNVQVLDLLNFSVLSTMDKPRTNYLSFSPFGTYIVLWEPFFINKTDQQSPDFANLTVYNSKTGQQIQSFSQKKQLENYIYWSNDEQVFSLIVNGQVKFFDISNPETPVGFIQMENLSSFNMNPVSKCIAVHITGKKNQPSSIRLYQYPNVTGDLANKSFFNTDNVEIKWNKAGSHLLILCSTETSANSYYGDTTLHYMNKSGETLAVTLSKKGPIYSLEWNPVKDEFIVVYGTMPAKATLFNNKCEALFDFGTGPRNECFFNPLGNIVCLAGFGNLRGRMELWNLSTSNKVPEQLCSITADDTTYFEWCPDGQHILTATTAPRLRVSNGYKIWNYAGVNQYTYQTPKNVELWQVLWQPGDFTKARPLIIKKPAVVKEEVKAYVPPHLRGKNQESSVKSKLREDDEEPDKCLKIKQKDEKSNDPAVIKEKKIKAIKKKIQQIEDLKKKRDAGTKLEANQLEKLSSEQALIDELKQLELE